MDQFIKKKEYILIVTSIDFIFHCSQIWERNHLERNHILIKCDAIYIYIYIYTAELICYDIYKLHIGVKPDVYRICIFFAI